MGPELTTFNRGRLAVLVLPTAFSVCVCVCANRVRTCSDLRTCWRLSNSLPLTQPAEFRYDMSAYILYQNQTIPEKWGGSLGVSWGKRLEYSHTEIPMS